MPVPYRRRPLPARHDGAPAAGDWRERLSLKRDLRRHEVLLNELRERKAEAAFAWKQDRPTARYVWRTQADEEVRRSHRANDGRVYSWSAPPETEHPGEDYNCRCSAEPYVSGETEFASFTFTSPLVSGARRWGNIDFVRHYFFGRGRQVNLMEIGHLNEIARLYAYDVDGEEVEGTIAIPMTKLRETKTGQKCIRDRYLDAVGLRREDGGIIDGSENGRLVSEPERTAAYRELYQPGELCNGYFTDMVGPGLLYPDNKHPFLPPCALRNRDNPSLRNSAWLNWPCECRSGNLLRRRSGE